MADLFPARTQSGWPMMRRNTRTDELVDAEDGRSGYVTSNARELVRKECPNTTRFTRSSVRGRRLRASSILAPGLGRAGQETRWPNSFDALAPSSGNTAATPAMRRDAAPGCATATNTAHGRYRPRGQYEYASRTPAPRGVARLAPGQPGPPAGRAAGSARRNCELECADEASPLQPAPLVASPDGRAV
ncbi:hypothetical protein TCAP_07093 [Tolypocladium capitatum]|uniref:Uncharacterized protein n=1 Tax=Tolypocladium capitatum TaxID=45235 RepID=A0A2K3Q521_9HYPO|nr:hypothetical protein TCAP_07093 [Tolypocladium capitatum]